MDTKKTYTLEWTYTGLNSAHLTIKRNNKWIGHLYFDCEDQELEEKFIREMLEPQMGEIK